MSRKNLLLGTLFALSAGLIFCAIRVASGDGAPGNKKSGGTQPAPGNEPSVQAAPLIQDHDAPLSAGRVLLQEVERTSSYTYPIKSDFLEDPPLERLAALREAMGTFARPARRSGFAEALEGMTAEDLPSVLEVFRAIPIHYRNNEDYEILLSAWAAFDAPAAVRFAEEKMVARLQDLGIAAAVATWAREDPKAVVSWLEAHDVAGEAHRLGLIRGWASHDAVSAAEYVATLENDVYSSRLLEVLVPKLYGSHPEYARKWALNLDGDWRTKATDLLAREWTLHDPAGAAEWIAGHTDQAYASGAVITVARSYALWDIEGALRFIEDLPAGSAQTESLNRVVEEWTVTDRNAVASYLARREPGPQLDAALASFGSRAIHEDPKMAMAYAMTIRDADIRHRTFIDMARTWYQNEPEAFVEWWATSSLSLNESEVFYIIR
jgi:hypothetical protein